MSNEFKQILQDAGIPTTEEEITQKWRDEVVKQGFSVNNQSPVSPFWRVLRSIVTQPALWLIDFLASHVLPNIFVQTAVDRFLDKLGEGRGVIRQSQVKAQGQLLFSRADNTGELIIAEGTVVQASPINGVVYELVLLHDIQFTHTQSSAAGMCEALASGQGHNLQAGYFNKIVPEVDGLSVTNEDNWLVRPGADKESDGAYRLRIRDAFANVGNFHVDAVYRNIISSFAGIDSQNIIFEDNAPRGPGTANAYTFLEVGRLPDDFAATITAYIQGGVHGLGDDVLVLPIPTQDIDISVVVAYEPNNPTTLNDIQSFIRCAFRQNDLFEVTKVRPRSVFSFSVLSQELHNQFTHVKSLIFNLDTIDVGLWLPEINNLQVDEDD